MGFLIEFLPLILFFGAFLYKDIYFALGVLMVAMPIAVVVKYLRTKSLDKMMFWSTVVLYGFGALTFYFRNPLFLYWKPTAFYWAVALAFLISQFIGTKPLVQRFFGLVDGFSLDGIEAREWRNLNLIWIAFFVAAGILNVYVAYNFSEAFWVKFKVFGLTAITFVFLLAQTFWIANKIDDSADEQEEQE